MNIRAGCLTDLPAMNQLMHSLSAYQGKYAAMLNGYQVSPAQLSKDKVFVAIDSDDRLLGFYSLIPEKLELDLMFVSDEAQGKGIGRLLFEHLNQLLSDLKITSIKIVSHPPAREFYLRMGAKHIGTQPPSGTVTWERPILEYRSHCLTGSSRLP